MESEQWRNFKFRAPLQENPSGPLLPNIRGVYKKFLLVGSKNRGALGMETRSRRRKHRGRKGMGRGYLSSRLGLGSVVSSPAGSGPRGRPLAENKTGIDALGASVFLKKKFHWATLHSPSFLRPPHLSFPPSVSPSLPSCPFPAAKSS